MLDEYVLVTTDRRGVFFGKLKMRDGDKALLTNARNVLSWTSENRGFLGLAADGPKQGARVGPAVPALELVMVTSVALCTPAAVKAFEAEPWG